jgi:hypothetical protein
MIDDLKEASRQWQLERTRAQSGGGSPTFYDPNVIYLRNSDSPIAYRHSETHHRQQQASAAGAVDPAAYGNPTPPAQYYSGPGQPQYSQPVANSYASQGYANAPQGNYGYQTSGNTYSPPPNQPSRYPPPQPMPQSYTPAEQPYLAGSNLGAAPQYAEFPREQPPRLPSGGPARVYASAPQQQPGYPAPAPAAGGFYSQSQQGQPMYAPVQVQPQDPFYGRGGGAGQYDDSASPTTQAQSDSVAGQANQNYSPEPAFEDNPSRTMPPTAAPAVAPVHNHKPDERHHRHHQPGRR